jgi:hypothetical protein
MPFLFSPSFKRTKGPKPLNPSTSTHLANARAMGGLPEEKLAGQGEGEKQRKEGDGLEEKQDVSFDTLGLDEQLTRALRKKGITVTTPIQREAIPLILVRISLF